MSQTITVLIFAGPQGSGKTTQAKRLAAGGEWVLVEAGQLLRDEKASGSELGKQIAALQNNGQLVPDEITEKLVDGRLGQVLAEAKRRIIFDGFPRTVKQSQPLIDLLLAQKAQVTLVVINADLETCRARLLGRGRHDDTPELIAKRFAWNQENGPKVEAHLLQQLNPRRIIVDGNQAEEAVAAEINRKLAEA